jgi:starch phosphorylase
MPAEKPKVAYFSMEIALEPEIPTYSGGLGVLAGDTLKSAADLGVPLVAVSLVHRKGYFRQKLDPQGRQAEAPDEWSPEQHLERLDPVVSLELAGRAIQVRAWRYQIQGIGGHRIPVLLLDTQTAVNDRADAALTDVLYGGDERYRLCQEFILGIGGYKMLSAAGYDAIRTFHMNEGHSALLTLALLERCLAANAREQPTDADISAVRRRCIFTTHTPVPAGHDRFSVELVREVLGEQRTRLLEQTDSLHAGVLNMTYLGLRFSHYINGVGMQHGAVSRGLFPEYPIRAITNGVHAVSWTSPAFQELYDRHIPEWRRDNLYLRYAVGINTTEIGEAHLSSKHALLAKLRETSGVSFDSKALTIGFARRATRYKRPELLFSRPDRLAWIARQIGPIQIVYGGKAHPNDGEGKEAIRSVFQAAEALRATIPFVYVENYDVSWARLLTSGADLWLNTPHRPFEASGTSGMKAALNGVPSLSVLDGWWIEGCIEGVTGWAIGSQELPEEDHGEEIASLYNKLEWSIVPMFYGRPQRYLEVMRSTISLNGSFFNTQRMLAQYVANAYGTE